MIDTHYHLDHLDDAVLESLLAESRTGGITSIVAPAMGLESAERLFAIKQRHPDFIKIGAGFHPERQEFLLADDATQALLLKEMEQLKQFAHNFRTEITAIGEIGLPYYSLEESRRAPEFVPSLSWRILDESLLLAKQLDLPVILHAVHSMALPCLEKLLDCHIQKAVFHWLKAPIDVVDMIVSHGYSISVTPEIVYRERSRKLMERVPLERLLVETDGPWPYEGPFAGRRTHPLWIRDTAQVIADVHRLPVETVLEIMAENARRLFRLGGE